MQQLEGRITNQISGVRGLNVQLEGAFYFNWYGHLIGLNQANAGSMLVKVIALF